ncbi:AAA family ATPase [Ruegeria sp.]|uniref:AAA family ATPase n=1 Tax=Ruegeria sp. TaxID=1879320 RepID=UPI003C7A50B5
MMVIAILLWAVVLLTLAWNFGWLNSLTRIPGAASFFGFMSAARSQQNTAGDSGSRGKLSDADRAKLFADARARLAALEGVEATEDDIMVRLIGPAEEDPENPFGTQSPALLALFAGPSGTGKTTAAVSAAQMLTGKGALETANIVTVRKTDLSSGQFGSAAQLARAKAEQAVGGALLIEDAGWLLADDGYGGPGPAEDFGQGLLDVLTQHPQRVFVAMTASTKDAASLQRASDVLRWLSKLTTRVFKFDDLPDDTLVELLEQRLEDVGWALEDDTAAGQARRLMAEIRDRAADNFDNAESCRRVAEQLVELVRGADDEEAYRRKIISRDVIRHMDDQLE